MEIYQFNKEVLKKKLKEEEQEKTLEMKSDYE